MYATDTLSQYPVLPPDEDDRNSCDELYIAVVSMATVCLSDIMITMPDFKEKIKHDEQYQILLKTIHKNSFADNKKAENDIIKDFFHVKDRLSVSDDLVLYSFEGGDLRLVIPKELRTQIIRNLHTAH